MNRRNTKSKKSPSEDSENHTTQSLDKLRTGVLVRVSDFLRLEELNELCLVSKSLQGKLLSCPKVKIRILEEKV